ncbi:MAG: hypothetical protein C3F07_01875 [Anaerolineales bacterium]|nr:hypothetical protein [Anaerolineae bacterium]PWB77588.1 MAG: hypothetical protein C3F07_01875 [Anaerolineales bacterium]
MIVGPPDAAVQESRERVQTAFENAGLHFPHHHCIVVNLSPASIRREGPAYELPIALGVIILSDRPPVDVVQDALLIGELSLGGVVRHTRGGAAGGCHCPPQWIQADVRPRVRRARSGFDPRSGGPSRQDACGSLRPSVWSPSRRDLSTLRAGCARTALHPHRFCRDQGTGTRQARLFAHQCDPSFGFEITCW